MLGIFDVVHEMNHNSPNIAVKAMNHTSRSVQEFVVPALPIQQYILTETAAAIIWHRKLSGDAARGICHKYEVDSSFIDESMGYRQISEALFARASDEKYYSRK